MSNQNTYISLEELVREYLLENGHTEHKFYRALQLGISCLRELNMDVSGQPQIKLIDVSDNDTVALPNDFISELNVFLCGSNGKMYPLSPDNEICLPRDTDDCGDLKTTAQVNVDVGDNGFYLSELYGSTSGGYEANHVRNGELIGGYFGQGGGQNRNGKYKIDSKNGFIVLSRYIGGNQIYLEYIADLSRTDGKFKIHPYIVNTIKQYIAWKMLSNNMNIPMIKVQEQERLYKESYRNSLARFGSFTVQELLSSLRKGNKLSPKF